ncbi:MAG: spore germination protein [Clostridia bacterium]|nr:spore germination protein [Clostridia bacterium]
MSIDDKLKTLIDTAGKNIPLKTKRFLIGRRDPLQAAIVYVDGLVNKDILDRDILTPLMLHVNEHLQPGDGIAAYICERYIAVGDTVIEENIVNAANSLKSGMTILLLDGVNEYTLINTKGGSFRSIIEPMNETSLRGSRESFVENLELNLNMIERMVKDKNLSFERLIIGRRSQTNLVLVYIDDIVDKDILNSVRKKIKAIDVDFVTGTGMVEQLIERSTYTIFPQVIYTERPDRVVSKIMEGRIAVIMNGVPFVFTLPVLFFEFFHTVEDYYLRTLLSISLRILRAISVFIVLVLPSIYLTLVKFNAELIPIDFIVPIMQSRVGIPLTPLIEILLVQVLIELLREGGLRLPSKIAQTISIVGGIIIGDAAVEGKIVSPSTLLVIGVTTVASFVIPNHDMSFVIRLLGYPMLILSNEMGIFGISTGLILILVHLLSLKSFGVPYLTFYKSDLKDILVRAPLWQMTNRPEGIPVKDKAKVRKAGQGTE